MKKHKMIQINYKNKIIKINTIKCSLLGKLIGLMFSKKENSPPLLFSTKKNTHLGIHSFFVFYNFLAIWLDKDYTVIEIKKVKPWKSYINCKKDFRHLIEIPINQKNNKVIKEILT